MEELLKLFTNTNGQTDIASMLPALLQLFQNMDKKKDTENSVSDPSVALYELMH